MLDVLTIFLASEKLSIKRKFHNIYCNTLRMFHSKSTMKTPWSPSSSDGSPLPPDSPVDNSANSLAENSDPVSVVPTFAYPDGKRQGKAVVSIVMGQREQNELATSQKNKHHMKAVSYTPSEFVAIMYATLMVLLDVALPVSEALRGKWQADYVVASFEVYLFFMSTIFLIYIQICLYKNKPHAMKDSENTAATSGSWQSRSRPTPSPTDIVLVRHLSKPLHSPTPSPLSTPPVVRHRGLTLAAETLSQSNIDPANPVNPSTNYLGLSGSLRNDEVFMEEEDSQDSDEMEEVVEYLSLKTQTASQAHEGTSLYLRLGYLIFTIGNLLLVGLQLKQYHSNKLDPSCEQPIIWPLYFHLLFLVVQSFFIFKHSVFYVKRWRGLARLGLMHVIATNMNVWLRYLVLEVMESVHLASKKHYGYDTHNESDPCSLEHSLYVKASPYLFPFVLEFSLISVATLLAMFSILNMPISSHTFDSIRQLLHPSAQSAPAPAAVAESPGERPHQELGMLNKSHTGVFLGFAVLSGTAVSIVMFFYNDTLEDTRTSVFIYQVSDITLHGIMIAAVVWGACRLYPLSTSYLHVNLLDDALLILSMSGLVLFELFVMISCFASLADSQEGSLLEMGAASAMLNSIQAILQTSFIVAGLQRRSTDPKHREDKPGRGALSFLIITNVSVWIFKMFQVKQIALLTHQDFYGDTAWNMILNINLPLLLFYRFHSSVCLADIWVSAYEDAESPMLLQALPEGIY